MRAGLSRVEAQDALDLATDPVDPAGHDLLAR